MVVTQNKALAAAVAGTDWTKSYVLTDLTGGCDGKRSIESGYTCFNVQV